MTAALRNIRASVNVVAHRLLAYTLMPRSIAIIATVA